MSPRWMGSSRYTYLFTKMRSWSSSEGIMLVPSTFTGWYRKMMMKQEIASEMIRSRSQTDNTMAREGAGGIGLPSWTALDSVRSACPGIYFSFYTDRALRVDIDSPCVRQWPATTTAAGFGLQYYNIWNEVPGYGEACTDTDISFSDYSDCVG